MNFQRMMLQCEHCPEKFSLPVGGVTKSFSRIRDPFEATCPHCKTQDSYLKSAIVMVGSNLGQ